MKLFIALFISFASLNSYASSSDRLVAACLKAGVEKIILEARALGLEVEPKAVKECGVDNRPFSPSKYVWFCATSKGGEKKFQQMTQKPLFGDCF